MRPYTTLFLLMSIDGKISTGSTDERDFDKDLPLLVGTQEGLHQYYEIEQHTDLYSLNTGRVMQKIGMNEAMHVDPSPVSFVVIDNKPHLTRVGVENLLRKAKQVIIVTTNPHHPARHCTSHNVQIMSFSDTILFSEMMQRLHSEYGVERLTVQSGGTLNAELIRENLIDEILLIVAPTLIGGKDTPTIMDGPNLNDIHSLKTAQLIEAKTLKNNYVQLRYKLDHSSYS